MSQSHTVRGRELGELVVLLARSIEEYGERPIRKAGSVGCPWPGETLRHLMEARGLTQKDLWKLFGSKGITSEVFHGKRGISKAQAKKLAGYFRVSVELFIWWDRGNGPSVPRAPSLALPSQTPTRTVHETVNGTRCVPSG